MFVGREEELARLAALSGAPLVTLWGTGGVGKTRLAREHGGERAVFTDLTGARTRADLLTAIAHALGGPEDARLAARDRLVIADHADRLQPEARAALASIGHVIVTSRSALAVDGEIAIELTPLDEAAASDLFEALTGLPPSDVTRAIVRRLDALPLAIELAAARVPILGASGLLARLDRKLDVLGALRGTIAWSWEQLDEDGRAALAAAARFEGELDALLYEAVLGDPSEGRALDRLEALRAQALVQVRAGGRLFVLESVRDFVREIAPDAVAALRARHATAILARAEPLAEAVRMGFDATDLEPLRADLEVIARGPDDDAPRARRALATLLMVTGSSGAAAELLAGSDVIERGEALRLAGRHRDAISLLEGLPDIDAALTRGASMRALGDTAAALREHETALARAAGDRAREARALGELGADHQSEGHLALARERHAAAIALHLALGSRRAEGTQRSFLAVATHRAGDPAGALALHGAALAIHRASSHRRLAGAELLHLGFVHHELAAYDEARASFAEARRELAAAGATALLAFGFVLSARLEVDDEHTAEALVFLAQATTTASAPWPRLAATHALVSGHLALGRGDRAGASAHYAASLAASRDVEVGFEVLTPAYRAFASGDRTDLDREKVLAHENPYLVVAFDVLVAAAAPEMSSGAARASSEVRRALRFAHARRSFAIDEDGKRVTLPDGKVIELARRKNVRLVLLALANARRTSPGQAVSPETLLEAGWPGERMRADTATKRLHTAIWTLRSLGLEPLLLTEGDGYLFDPRFPLVF